MLENLIEEMKKTIATHEPELMDSKDWFFETGVLLTANEAKMILEALKGEDSS